MDRALVLARYDAEMRARPYLPDNLSLETHLGALCVTGHYNCVIHTRLSEGAADAAIEAVIARFAGAEVEWKVHGHDRPSDLADRLAAKGFEPDPAETLLALDLVMPAPTAAIDNLDIRRVTDAGGLDDFVLANSAGFEADRSSLHAEFADRLDDPTAALFVAYDDGRPVASARMELPPGRPFAGLYSGSVAPGFRGRGLYRALIEVRLALAREAGHAFAMVEALETSRPILQRLGFAPLTTVQGWLLRPQAA